MTYCKQDVEVYQTTICKVEIEPTSIRYGFDSFTGGYHIGSEKDLLLTKEQAEIRAKELAEEWNKEQLARIHQKEKNNRTWSWHVHYHRSQIRDAEKTIKRSTAKLNAAKEHVKEEKK